MSTNFFLVVAGLLAACSIALGGEPPKEGPDVAQLVKDLGSPRFAVREAAEQHLVELGAKTKPAVLAGTKDADPEVARRCEAILPKIRAAERKAFVDGKVDWPEPAGMKFKKMVGDTKAARELFALLTDDDRRAGLARRSAAAPDASARLYAAEVTRLGEVEERAGLALPAAGFSLDALRDAFLAAVSPGDVALALYLGALGPAGAMDPVEVQGLFGPAFVALAAGPTKGAFGKLFAAWLGGRGPSAARAGLLAALAADVPSAAGPARRIAADRTAGGPVVGAAVLVLGRHGSKEDLALLSDLRDDRRVYEADVESRSSTQVRDMAAAASLSVRGKRFWDYGFQKRVCRVWWGDDYTVPALFRSDAERNAALTKAWDWLDKQPGAPPAPKK